MKTKILWITRTALFTALLVVMQVLTAPMGITFITGTIVNLILIVSVMVCGLTSGLTVALISPVCAKLVGIGPFWTLIPFIIVGNFVLVFIWHYLGNSNFGKKYTNHAPHIVAIIIAAFAKFVVLYLGIAQLAVPIILQLPQPQASVISGIFSVPQLFTALAGGFLAFLILPVVKRAVTHS